LSINPPNHFLATANHNILPPGYAHQISYEWASIYRYARIRERLEAKEKCTLEDFQSIQHDNTSIPGRTLARLLKNVQWQDEALRPFPDMMSGWNGDLSRESKAGPLYAVWLQELLDAFYRPHVPARLLEFVRSRGGVAVMLAAMERPDRNWFGENAAAERDKLLRQTFARAVAKTKKLLGTDVDRWGGGKLGTATFRHPLATLGPAYAKAFNLGPVPRSGDGLTPHATGHNPQFEQITGASYRHVFDLADWDKGLATSTPGQSGQPGSPH